MDGQGGQPWGKGRGSLKDLVVVGDSLDVEGHDLTLVAEAPDVSVDADVGVWDPLCLVLLELKEEIGQGPREEGGGGALSSRTQAALGICSPGVGGGGGGGWSALGHGGKEGPAHQLRVLAVDPVADVGGAGAVVDPEGEACCGLVRGDNPPEEGDLQGKQEESVILSEGEQAQLALVRWRGSVRQGEGEFVPITKELLTLLISSPSIINWSSMALSVACERTRGVREAGMGILKRLAHAGGFTTARLGHEGTNRAELLDGYRSQRLCSGVCSLQAKYRSEVSGFGLGDEPTRDSFVLLSGDNLSSQQLPCLRCHQPLRCLLGCGTKRCRGAGGVMWRSCQEPEKNRAASTQGNAARKRKPLLHVSRLNDGN